MNATFTTKTGLKTVIHNYIIELKVATWCPVPTYETYMNSEDK